MFSSADPHSSTPRESTKTFCRANWIAIELHSRPSQAWFYKPLAWVASSCLHWSLAHILQQEQVSRWHPVAVAGSGLLWFLWATWIILKEENMSLCCKKKKPYAVTSSMPWLGSEMCKHFWIKKRWDPESNLEPHTQADQVTSNSHLQTGP